MTQKEIDRARELARDTQDKTVLEELSCREMIDSTLCYQYGLEINCDKKTILPERVLNDQEDRYHNYLADYVEKLGKTKVLQLIQEQLDSISHILFRVHTDSEGCTYNSIVYKEE